MLKFIAAIAMSGLLVGCGAAETAMDIGATRNKSIVTRRGPKQNDQINRGIIEDNPFLTEVQASDYEGDAKIGGFSTEFKNAKKARADNITLAAKKVNGKVIEPGETFSFNECVGPTTKHNGFKLGIIFNSGRKSKGYGGGVCQVSSTIYNAALEAGMEIIERHAHSLKVDYVPDDKDAATSYGVKDLTFKNPHDYPVIVSTYVKDEEIFAEIYKQE